MIRIINLQKYIQLNSSQFNSFIAAVIKIQYEIEGKLADRSDTCRTQNLVETLRRSLL